MRSSNHRLIATVVQSKLSIIWRYGRYHVWNEQETRMTTERTPSLHVVVLTGLVLRLLIPIRF
jgi:hypothetical protein